MAHNYRAAAVAFVYPHHGVLFGYELDKNKRMEWKLFSGKKEPEDQEDPTHTAARELQEESEGQVELSAPYSVYYEASHVSKMVLCLKECDAALSEKLTNMSPTKDKVKYRWIRPKDFDKFRIQPYIQKLLDLPCTVDPIYHVEKE